MIAPGVRVRVIAGLSKGRVGVVVERAETFFLKIPMWHVDLDDCPNRTIREDYLEVDPRAPATR